MKLQHRILVFLFTFFSSFRLFGGEGMWLPLLLKSLNEADMKAMGMKLSAEDIYSINKGSLKDAIVSFGGGCTSEIISPNGLLLTNHHCGYGYIAGHSSVENNILKNGFWAKSNADEKICGGLTATLIVRMEDVSSTLLKGVGSQDFELDRKAKIEKNVAAFKKEYKLNKNEELFVRAFYNGNQYFAFITKTFKDVRLVGTPPESIGKFGSDTDNWVWPRHTGDFSIFRIYADKNNEPAEYAESNVPYQPKHFLPISLDGVAEGDFTMVFGFPGRTNEYLTEEGVRQIVEVQNPIRIRMREKALSILDQYMRKDEATKLKFAASYASISNAYKKWIGENQGIKQTKGLEKKHERDALFQQRVDANANFSEYKNLVSELESQYKSLEKLSRATEIYAEAFQRNVSVMNFYSEIKEVMTAQEVRGEKIFIEKRNELHEQAEALVSGFNKEIDQEIFTALAQIAVEEMPKELMLPYLREQLKQKSVNEFVVGLYRESKLTDGKELKKLTELSYSDMAAALKTDPLWQFYDELNYYFANDLSKQSVPLQDKIVELRRKHMAALMQVIPEKKYYPDANSTMRISFGRVEGFSPKDGSCYKYQTYLDGVMEKYIPNDYEFDVHPKLIELYNTKSYGQYGENGKMPLAFIGSNHTTGGNSGSPAIDAYGNLIGLNFDRVWEGTMSDINYDVSICRNIMVDARYILFIIDEFAGAKHLIQEMKLVHPKANSSKKKKKK